MTDHITQLHPDIDAFRAPGGLFDVPFCDLDMYIGKKCQLKNPSYDYEHDTFTVVCPQKIWNGQICLRIVGNKEKYKVGIPAALEDIIFLKETK